MKRTPKELTKEWKILVIPIVLIVIIVAAFFIKKEVDRKNREMEESAQELSKQEVKYDTSKIKEEMQKQADESKIGFKIESAPVFPSGTEEGYLAIENVPANKVAFRVKVKLNDSGKKVYDSGKVDPGVYIGKVTLSENLKKGEYPATAYVYAYDTKGKETKNCFTVDMKITIES